MGKIYFRDVSRRLLLFALLLFLGAWSQAKAQTQEQTINIAIPVYSFYEDDQLATADALNKDIQDKIVAAIKGQNVNLADKVTIKSTIYQGNTPVTGTTALKSGIYSYNIQISGTNIQNAYTFNMALASSTSPYDNADVTVDASSLSSSSSVHAIVSGAIIVNQVVSVTVPNVSMTTSTATSISVVNAAVKAALNKSNKGLEFDGIGLKDPFQLAAGEYQYKFRVTNNSGFEKKVLIPAGAGKTSFVLANNKHQDLTTTSAYVKVTTAKKSYTISAPEKLKTSGTYGSQIDGAKLRSEITLTGLTEDASNVGIKLLSDKQEYELSSTIPAGTYTVVLSPTIPSDPNFEWNEKLTYCSNVEGKIYLNAKLTVRPQTITAISVPVYTSSTDLKAFAASATLNTIVSAIKSKIVDFKTIATNVELLDENNNLVMTPQPGQTYGYRIYLNPNYAANAKTVVSLNGSVTPTINSRYIDIPSAVEIEKLVSIVQPLIKYNTVSNASDIVVEDALKASVLAKLNASNKNAVNNGILSFESIEIIGVGNNWPLIEGTSYGYKFKVKAGAKAIVLSFPGTTLANVSLAANKTTTTSIEKTNSITVSKGTSTVTITAPVSTWGTFQYGTAPGTLTGQVKITGISGVTPDIKLVSKTTGVTYQSTSKTIPAGSYKVILTVTIPKTSQTSYDLVCVNCTESGNSSTETTDVYTIESDKLLTISKQPITTCTLPVFTGEPNMGDKIAVNSTVADIISKITTNFSSLPKSVTTGFKLFADNAFTTEVVGSSPEPGVTYSYRILLNTNYSVTNVVLNNSKASYNSKAHSIDVKDAVVVEGYTNIATYTKTYSTSTDKDVLSSGSKLKADIWAKLIAANTSIAEVVELVNNSIVVSKNGTATAISATGQVYPGTYDYKFTVKAKAALKAKVSGNGVSPTEFTLEETNNTQEIKVTGQIKVNAATVSGKLECPTSWKPYTYGTPISDLGITWNVKEFKPKYYLVSEDEEIEYTGANKPAAGEYHVKIAYNDKMATELFKYNIKAINCKLIDEAIPGVYMADAILTVKPLALPEAIVFPVFTDGSFGKMAANTTVANAVKALMDKMEGGKTDKMVTGFKIYDKDFKAELAQTFKLVSGETYSYEVVLSPNYTQGKNISASVGGKNITFTNGAYRIQSAIEVAKTPMTIKLPSYLDVNALKTGFYTNAELITILTDQINLINPDLAKNSLTATVTTKASEKTTNGSYADYSVAISGDNTSKYNFTYATNGNVSSTQLVPATDGKSCTFKNALYFLDQLLTDKDLTLPTLSVNYSFKMKPTAIIEQLTSALVLANPSVLSDPKQYTVTLINATEISETVGNIGYKLTIQTTKDVLEDVTVLNWDDKTMTRNDDQVKGQIELSYMDAITVLPRESIDLTIPDYTIQYVEGLTNKVIGAMLADSLHMKNAGKPEFISSIKVGKISEKSGTVSYTVLIDNSLQENYSEVRVNGQALVWNDRKAEYEAKVTIVPRPIVTVKLYKYDFKKDGATEELMEQAILADLLVKNPVLKGAYIGNVKVDYVSENLYSYQVYFNPTNKIQEINPEPDGFNITWNGKANTGMTIYAASTVTLNPNGGIVLAEYPFEAKVKLPLYSGVFGLTAEEHAAAILKQLQDALTVGTNIPMPSLDNWGVKVQLIKNTTGYESPLDGQSYPEVSDLYGYRIITDANTQFAQYYKMVYEAAPGMSVVAEEEIPNNVVVKLSAKVTMATGSLTTPGVSVAYGDDVTKAFGLASIKEAILLDNSNKDIFDMIARTGIAPENSFTVTFTGSVPEEGALSVGDYSYDVTFNDVVTRNISIGQTGEMKLVVGKAAESFIFNPSYSFVYGKTKEAIESQIKAGFLADNEALLSRYACFANSGDLFTVELTPIGTAAIADKPGVADGYGYKVTATSGLLTNFDLRDANDNTQFEKNNVQSVEKSVNFTEKTVKITLPTYLGEIEGTASAKAAFIYGKATKDEIQKAIKDDIIALNAKKLKGEYTLYVTLVADGDYPAYSKEAYSYKVKLTSNDFKYKFEIGQSANIAVDPDNTDTQIVSGAVLVNPANVSTIVFDAKQQNITGTWEINKQGKPAFTSSLSIGENAYGWNLVSFTEAPEVPISMTEARWNELFESGKLVWALKQGGEVKYYASALADLIDKVKAEVTAGKFDLTIIETPTTLKSVVGNFDIPLGQSLATLTVTPAIVKVNPAEESYTKTYGTEVTKATDFTKTLTFATEPVLNSASLVDDYNVIDLFVTTAPVGEDVYAAYSPVGGYTIQTSAAREVVGAAFKPVVGVVFEAGATAAAVTITPAPMNDDVKLNVSASREYGEDPVDGDIAITVTGQEGVDANLVEQISAALNTAEGRVNWIDWASFNKKTNAGKYEVRFTSGAIASMKALLENFNMDGVTVTLDSLEIRKADLTVIAEDKNRVYGVANPELTIAYEGLKNNEFQSLDDVFDGDVLPAVATDATVSSHGSWEIYFTQQPTAKNYNVTYVTGNLSIDKIKRTIVWPEDQRNLTIAVGELVELSAAVTSADDNKLSITGLRYELTNNDRERVVLYQNENGKMMVEGKVRTLDGPVTITVYADGDETTYMDADPVTGTVTVIAPEGEAANVNIIVSNVTSVYDGTPRAVTVKAADKDGKEVDYKIFYEGDQTASTVYPSDQNAPVDAGTYKVTVKAEVGSTTFVYEAKNKMIIAPRVVEVKARSFTTTYGNTVPDYSKAYDYDKSDFLAGEDFDADKTPIVRAEAYKGNAGTYKLTPYSAQDFGKNYKVSYISGELVINKAPLTIIADNQESVYGKDLAELTYQLDGLVNGETIKNLGFAPRISSTVTKGADAGTYPIVFADNYESANYEVAYKEGKYVVVPAEQKISWNPETTYKLEQRDIPLTAMASSKLPVSYVSDNDAVAYVNQIGDNWILTLVSDGLVKIKAIQNGNTNYWAAEPVEVTFAIGNAYESVDNESIIVSDHIEVYPTVFTTNVTVAAPSAIKRVELVSYAGVLLKVFDKPESVINLSNFGKGFYLLNVTLEDGTFKSVKLIKK